jgi:hypothetical protein
LTDAVSEPSTRLGPDTLSVRAAYRVGAGVTAAEGAGAEELPRTIGRFAHADSPVSNVTNASPSTTDFRVFIAILLLLELM